MTFRAEGRTAAGKYDYNDDRFFIEEDMIIVADGAGTISTSGGKDAGLAIDVIARTVKSGQSLSAAFEEADRVVSEKTNSDTAWRGAEPSVVAAHLAGARIRVAHAGRCRAYFHHDGAFYRLTEDHGFERVAALQHFDAGRYPNVENIITSAIGFGEQFAFDVVSKKAESGDLLVLCTKGVWRGVNESDMARVVAQFKGRAAAELIGLSQVVPGDNATVVVAEVV